MSIRPVAFSFFLTLMVGCAVTPPALVQEEPETLRQTDEFTYLILGARHSYADALQLAPGVISEEDLLALNGPRLAGEQVIVVPLKPHNPGGFFSDGFRLIPILCYHQFTSDKEVSQRLEVTADDFRKQLGYLRDNNFTVLSLKQVEEILQAKRAIPERAVVLTIDDGYRSVYDVALPVIKEFGFPFTLYVYTDFVGGGAAMTWAQLKEVQATGLVDVQSHGKSHTSLSRLEQDTSETAYLARVNRELAESQRILSRRLGHKPWQISYPYGNASDALPQVMAETGYRVGLTVTRGDNAVYADPHFLHRTMIYGDHSLADFKKLVATFRSKALK